MAGNPNTPSSSIRVLVDPVSESVQSVRKAAARNPLVAAAVLQHLAESDDACMRTEAARNPETPSDLLNRLSKDCPEVRAAVAENSNVPLEVLSQLTSDPDPSVRCRAAENAAIPANALERLASDADQSVRFCALGQIAARDAQGKYYVAIGPGWEMPVDVAGDSKTPSCVLRWLAESDVEELLIKLGKNPNTPMDILVRLSDDERDRVRDGGWRKSQYSIRGFEEIGQRGVRKHGEEWRTCRKRPRCCGKESSGFW